MSKSQLYLEYEALNNTQPNFGNPVAENGAPLFVKPVQNHNNPFNDNKVNPEHPCAPFYQRLMDSLKQGSQDGVYDPYLDDVTDYHESSSEDKKEVARKHRKLNKFLKHKLPTNPSGVRYTEEDSQAYKEGWDDRENDPDCHAYDRLDNRYHRYVSNTDNFTHIDDQQLVALVSSLCSLTSNVEHNKMPHSANCVKCSKKHKYQINLLADSGTSLHFTNQRVTSVTMKLSMKKILPWQRHQLATP